VLAPTIIASCREVPIIAVNSDAEVRAIIVFLFDVPAISLGIAYYGCRSAGDSKSKNADCADQNVSQIFSFA